MYWQERIKSIKIEATGTGQELTISASDNSGETIIKMDAETPGVNIYYTIDNSMPDNQSNKYEIHFRSPKALSHGG